MQTIRDIIDTKQPGILKFLKEPPPAPSKPKPYVRETSDMRAAKEYPIEWAQNAELHVYSFPLGNDLDMEIDIFYSKYQRAKNEKLNQLYGENNASQFKLRIDSQWTLEDVHAFIRQMYSNWRSLMTTMDYARHNPQYQEGCRVLRVRMNEAIYKHLQVTLEKIAQRSKPPVQPIKRISSVSSQKRGWPYDLD